MAVRARFYVATITEHAGAAGLVVVLRPVIRQTPDNIAWSKYTPSGELTMNVTDDSAAQWYRERLGKDVAIVMDDTTE